MQYLLNLSNIFYKIASSLPNPIIAYHTGAFSLEGDMFSIKHLKSGEGMTYLGPGTYFVDDEKTAKGYAKYRPNDATIYKCKIDTSRCYDPFKGIPEMYRGVLGKIGEELLQEFNLKKLPYASSFDYGVYEIGQTHKLLGPSKAIAKFIQHGFSGFVQEIQPEVYELCIFDYSTIQILDKKLLVELKEEQRSEFDDYKLISMIEPEDLSPGDIVYYKHNIENDEGSFIIKVDSISDIGIKFTTLVGSTPFDVNFISFKDSFKMLGWWWLVNKN